MCRSLTGPPSGPSLQHSGRQDVGGGDPGSQAASDGSCGGAEPGKDEAEA